MFIQLYWSSWQEHQLVVVGLWSVTDISLLLDHRFLVVVTADQDFQVFVPVLAKNSFKKHNISTKQVRIYIS